MYSAERRSSVVTQFGSEKPSPGSVCWEYFFFENILYQVLDIQNNNT